MSGDYIADQAGFDTYWVSINFSSRHNFSFELATLGYENSVTFYHDYLMKFDPTKPITHKEFSDTHEVKKTNEKY